MASWFDVYIWGITFRWRSWSLRVVSPLQIKDTPGISWVTLMKPLPLAGKDGKCLGHWHLFHLFHSIPIEKKTLYNVIYIYIIICRHDNPITSTSKISLQILNFPMFSSFTSPIFQQFFSIQPDIDGDASRRILKDDDTLESTKADGSQRRGWADGARVREWKHFVNGSWEVRYTLW